MIGDTAAGAQTLGGGRYKLGEVLGTGGMAMVRSATDTVLGRVVAVKLFRTDLDEDSAARARTEMQTLAALAHPGLVRVYDAGTDLDAAGTPQPFLVMELVDGPTLAACCQDQSLTADQLTDVGAGLADALQYVHDRGVIHRDVKPANILLSPSGVKLADFGIARIVDGARHTGTGLTIGTAPYLSPEQVTGVEVGPAADIYALGLVLLECLTGHREYTGGSVETAMARLHRQPVVPTSLPSPWPALLTAMTARDARARPTAGQVAGALRSGSFSPTSRGLLPVQDTSATRVLPSIVGGGTDTSATRVLPGTATEPGAQTPTRTVPRVVPAPRGPRRALLETVRHPSLRLVGGLLALLVIGIAVTVAIAVGGSGGSSAPSTPTVSTGPNGPLEQHISDLNQAVTP